MTIKRGLGDVVFQCNVSNNCNIFVTIITMYYYFQYHPTLLYTIYKYVQEGICMSYVINSSFNSWMNKQQHL